MSRSPLLTLGLICTEYSLEHMMLLKLPIMLRSNAKTRYNCTAKPVLSFLSSQASGLCLGLNYCYDANYIYTVIY